MSASSDKKFKVNNFPIISPACPLEYLFLSKPEKKVRSSQKREGYQETAEGESGLWEIRESCLMKWMPGRYRCSCTGNTLIWIYHLCSICCFSEPTRKIGPYLSYDDITLKVIPGLFMKTLVKWQYPWMLITFLTFPRFHIFEPFKSS